MSDRRILIVDDDPAMRDVLSVQLGKQGFLTIEAYDGLEAWEIFQKGLFDAVITDIEMPRMNGEELAARVRERSTSTVIIILTGHGSLESATRAIYCGCDDYLLKPFRDINEIGPMVKHTLERRRLLINAAVKNTPMPPSRLFS
jgi:two-component system response regulator AtoC